MPDQSHANKVIADKEERYEITFGPHVKKSLRALSNTLKDKEPPVDSDIQSLLKDLSANKFREARGVTGKLLYVLVDVAQYAQKHGNEEIKAALSDVIYDFNRVEKGPSSMIVAKVDKSLT